jgi:hypothetical protein
MLGARWHAALPPTPLRAALPAAWSQVEAAMALQRRLRRRRRPLLPTLPWRALLQAPLSLLLAAARPALLHLLRPLAAARSR